MPEYSRNIAATFLEGLATAPEKKCKAQQRNGDDDQPRPFESLGDSRTHGSHRARRGFQVGVGNLVRGEDTVLQNETIFANRRDDPGAHFSSGKINVDKAVFVHAKVLNGEFIAGLFGGEHKNWPWETA